MKRRGGFQDSNVDYEQQDLRQHNNVRIDYHQLSHSFHDSYYILVADSEWDTLDS
jgi:hypothetical protein